MAEAVKDYQKLEHDIIRLAGGADNIASAQRCATRLRLVLKNTPGQAEEKIKALPGVITVVQKQGQFQVVIGNHVGDVFEAVSAELETNKKTEQEERPKKRKPVKPPASDDIRSICTCLLCPCSRMTFTGIADHSYNGSTIRDRNRSLSGNHLYLFCTAAFDFSCTAVQAGEISK